jgi:hypothetical protein
VRTQATYVRGGYRGPSFTAGWYRGYRAWQPVRWRAGNVWTAPVWAPLAGYCGITAAPIVYDYGSNVVIENNAVYVDGESTVTAPEYAAQATEFANQGREAPVDKDEEWQPLGVFGLIQGEEKESTNIFQLAINKAGIVRGNYYNAVADQNHPVYGSLDRKSQRVAWSIGDKKTVVFETGLGNLTQEQTSVLVHYGNDQTKQMMLIRFEEPEGEAK